MLGFDPPPPTAKLLEARADGGWHLARRDGHAGAAQDPSNRRRERPIRGRPGASRGRHRLSHRSLGPFEHRLVAILERAQHSSRTLGHRAAENRLLADLIAADQPQQLRRQPRDY
jgi:hypothetical protein